MIIGNRNAITYKNTFPLIKKNKIWLGYTPKIKIFRVPDYYSGKDVYIANDGIRYVKNVGIACWFTNLVDISKRHEKLILYKHYNPEEYPKYDNYDAINVDKVADIPCDYDGVMGVPITFLDKYNPEQFEIIWLDCDNPDIWVGHGPSINGKNLYRRLLIRRIQ